VSSDDVASKIFKTEKEATEEFYINETKIHLKSSKVNIAKLTRIQLIEFGKKIDESIAVFRGIKN
jgi:transcription initiation factor IIE alpha subunit